MENKKPRKGMLVSVLRSTTDCTNGGVSSRHATLLLVGPGVPEVFEERAGLPVLVLASKQVGGTYWYCYEERAGAGTKICGPMAGGNYVTGGGDSRFRNINGGHPIPVHDRFDTWEDHNRLSI